MLAIILRRLLASIPLVLVVTLLAFLLNQLAPGDLAATIVGADASREQYEILRKQLGLDQPLLWQYGAWLVQALQGDLGTSFFTGERVADLVNERLAVSLCILAGLLLVCVSAGLVLGVASALRGGWVGRAIDTLSLVGLVFPSFWLALVLISVFAVWLQWLPATGYTRFSDDPWAWLLGLVLPVLSVSMYSITSVAKQTRDAMADVMGRDFIRALRASGVPERSVVWKHGLRNAALPVVTVLGLVLIAGIGGTVFVERIFVLPGLGSLAVSAAQSKDVVLLQGVTLYFTLITIVINLLVDLSYGWLNPKVRGK
ncbi:MAG: ABC transporter permease [Ramlibacter sp.]|uniref:ABC transporter permease n=1 Tax=Ramlibacter sp. TaxID=1917967 RepID=UPI00260C2CA1|nr:ABC transporter permease [Ramlibacter sp.]MDH4377749.1 ABC transporter permease [Ramlibacter sp.]